MLLKTKDLTIYFGDLTDSIHASEQQRTEWAQQKNILELAPFNQLKNSLDINHLVFDHQIHGTSGRIVTQQSAENLRPWSHDGDYLITQETNLGIGVLTADCLPIVLHDPINNVIAVIHAGWRGAVNHIALQALKSMQNTFNTQANNIKVYFGPCIGPCCYCVGQEVINAIHPYANEVLEEKNQAIYFNLKSYNKLLLEQAGVPLSSFNATYNCCTHCSGTYCSYRRNKTQQRQVTIACLLSLDKNNQSCSQKLPRVSSNHKLK